MNSSDIKRKALFALQDNWGIAILAAIIASALGGMSTGSVSIGGGGYSGGGGNSSGSSDVAMDEKTVALIISLAGVFMAIAFVAVVAQFVVGSAIWVGYSRFNLALIDLGEGRSIGTLFSGFKMLKTALLTRLLQTLFISLWSMLFLIPGIIASYRYAMTGFILAENPDYSPRMALDESKRMMRGNKWRLFCLDMSFIGWHILCICTLGIGYIWLTPYIQASYAAFYRDLLTPTSYNEGYEEVNNDFFDPRIF